jgi:hypothetical protein
LRAAAPLVKRLAVTASREFRVAAFRFRPFPLRRTLPGSDFN